MTYKGKNNFVTIDEEVLAVKKTLLLHLLLMHLCKISYGCKQPTICRLVLWVKIQ